MRRRDCCLGFFTCLTAFRGRMVRPDRGSRCGYYKVGVRFGEGCAAGWVIVSEMGTGDGCTTPMDGGHHYPCILHCRWIT
jgi:hypothetical protein